MTSTLHAYYWLMKPRLALLNVAVAAAAFVFASGEAIDWRAFTFMAVGLFSVVGSACAINNVADRGMDAHMERTKNRALVTGAVQPRHAYLFAAALLALGVYLLAMVNLLTLGAALIGFLVYVLLYTPLKPRTPHALWAGSVAGAMPPVVGYAAGAGVLDVWAWSLFAFLFVWQIVHFLAIAKFRHAEYSAAGVPLFVHAPKSESEKRWARKIFFYSLWVLVLLCFALILQR